MSEEERKREREGRDEERRDVFGRRLG